MGVTAALTAVSTAATVIGGVAQGISEKRQAEANAQVYEAQARNIQEQQKIVAGQYRTKANVLRGEATASAAHSGLKISGTTASSISQSIMELQMDRSYQQYNLEAQKQEAFNNAAMQRFQGKQAYANGIFKAGSTALNGASDFYNKYWKGTNNNSGWTWGSKTTSSGNNALTWVKGQANKVKSWKNTRLSGGLPTTNKQILQGNQPMA